MRRHVAIALFKFSLLAAVVGGAAVFILVSSASKRTALRAPPPPVPAEEQARTIAGMRPPKRARPVIAVIGQNDGTETTDFIIPYAVLAQSGAADVFAVAPERRPIRLTPALTIQPHTTTAAFDDRYADGADYVIVPKIEDAADPAVVGWIEAQAAKGATIVGVCSGVKTVAAAGLLAGRSATGHWYDLEGLKKAEPTLRWVPDRRYVADRGVVTTTGVSASLPVSLALVEAIAGKSRAAQVANELGVTTWDARHDSAAFKLDGRLRRTAIQNRYLFWRRETYRVPVEPGVDDVALSFIADSWSRTFRSRALTVAKHSGGIQTRHGLTLVPDLSHDPEAPDSMLPASPSLEPAQALPDTLGAIAERYGDDTASFVALQLEYSWRTPERALP